MVKSILVLLVSGSSVFAALTSQPASRPASQPSVSLYYGVLKNEFCKDANNNIIPVPDNIRSMIDVMKAKAKIDKDTIDKQIVDLNQKIADRNRTRSKIDQQADDVNDKAAHEISKHPDSYYVHRSRTPVHYNSNQGIRNEIRYGRDKKVEQIDRTSSNYMSAYN